MEKIYKLALVLLMIGGFVWGSIGLFDFNPIESLFGGDLYHISRIIYVLVGISSFIVIPLLYKHIEVEM
ncbi:MAG: DUF378 domain-containing protein [Bacilli bacterium]